MRSIVLSATSSSRALGLWSGVCAIVATLIVPACSSTGDDAETEIVIQSATGDWVHPACDVNALAPPLNDPQACNGPSVYSYQEMWADPIACGGPICIHHNSCPSWDLETVGDGRGYTTADSVEQGPFPVVHCDDVFGCDSEPDGECLDAAAARRSALLQARPGISQQALNDFTVTTEIPLIDTIEHGCGPFDQFCAHDYTYSCRLHVNKFPTEMTGEHPWCSCAQTSQPECLRKDGVLTSSDVPKSIPGTSSASASSVIVVPGGVNVEKVLVDVQITYPQPRLLEVSIVAPNGHSVVVSGLSGPLGVPNVSITNRDITSLVAAGGNASGNWQLQTRKLAAAGTGTGTIDVFRLKIISTAPFITTVFVPPGMHMPDSPGDPSPGSTSRAFVDLPSCQTCDQKPLGSDADAQAKFACLDKNLANATGDLKSSLAARMKLLMQLKGEQLTPVQRTRVEGVYDELPDATPFCAAPIAWDSACRTSAAALRLPGQIQLCNDLGTNTSTSSGILALELQHCFDQLTTVAQISADTCRLSTRDAADAAARGVVSKTYPDLTGGTNITAALPAVLGRIGAWWTAASVAAAGDRAWLGGHSNLLLRQLWANIQRTNVPLPSLPFEQSDTGRDAAANLVTHVTDIGFTDDFAVLSALFAPPAPGTTPPPITPPLLTLTGDALQPIADRLQRLEVLHDVGCRFRACRASPTSLRASAISELAHALSALPDHDMLASVLASATELSAKEPQLYAALVRVRDQHSYLGAAWAALGRTEPFAHLATIPDPPAEVAGLATLVRVAGIAWSSYQGSGIFVPWNQPRLTAATLQRDRVVSTLDQLLGDTTIARDAYVRARLDTVNDIVAQSRQQGVIQSVVDRAAALRDQDEDLLKRMIGLASREAQERSTIAGYQAAFETLVNSGALDADAAYQTQTQDPVRVSADQAKYPGISSPRNVVRDRFASIPLHSGDSLRLQVTGTWTPTCAVRPPTKLRGPGDNDFEPIQRVDEETGPEGYWLSREGDAFKSHSTTISKDYRTDFGFSVEFCIKSPSAPTGGGPEWKACVHDSADWISSDAQADATGSSSRMSASFAVGLRLPNTPFPEAPAGSLVAVLTRSGHPEEILDIRVVQRQDLIWAPAQSNDIDVNFVVNDLFGCAVDTTKKLQIDSVKTTPLGTSDTPGSIASAIQTATAATLDAIEAKAPDILAEGQLTNEESASLRSSAWSEVETRLPHGIGLAGLPYEIRQLFETFLDYEIASIARRALSFGMARQRVQLELAAEALAHEAKFADDQNRLLLLVPRWRLRDLSGVSLFQSTDALAAGMTSYVAQIYELRAPGAFTLFHKQLDAGLDGLIDLNLTGPYESSIDALADVTKAARNTLNAAHIELENVARLTIAVAVPKPPSVACQASRCDYQKFWSSVSPATANSFWSDMAATPASVTLKLTPNDLYADGGGTARLSCRNIAPVVRRMAAYLDTRTDTDGDIRLITIDGQVSTALFPLIGKQAAVDVTDEDGTVRSAALQIPALRGDVPPTAVADAFGTSDLLGVGAGISPFTTLNLDMRALNGTAGSLVLAKTRAILLVFDIDVLVTSGDDFAYVPGVCPQIRQ